MNHWRQIITVAIIVVIIGVVAFVAWQARPGQEPSNSIPDNVVSLRDLPVGMTDDSDPKPGGAAPDFVLERADGTKIRLSDLRGRPIFLNFWADWCPFCKEEMPDMQRVQDEFGDDLVVVGINTGDPLDIGENFVKRVGVNYLVLYDFDLQVQEGYNVRVMPTSYFIDAEGVIVDFNFGYMTFDQMLEKVAGILDSDG